MACQELKQIINQVKTNIFWVHERLETSSYVTKSFIKTMDIMKCKQNTGKLLFHLYNVDYLNVESWDPWTTRLYNGNQYWAGILDAS